jgi:nitroreductase
MFLMHELLKKRRSTRKFKNTIVEVDKIKQIVSAGMVAPSYCNQKLYELVIVSDKSTLLLLSGIGRWVDFVANCGVAIVVISKESAGWIEDCALVNGWMMIEATNLGLSTCWADVKDGKELDNTDREPVVRNILNIPKEYRVLNILAIGYPDQNIKEHSETEYREKKVHFEKF